MHLRAALAHQDLPGVDALAAERLDAEALGVGIAPVARAAARFLVSHALPLQDIVDADLGVRLPMALRFLVVLAPAQLEDFQFLTASVRHHRALHLGAGDERRADLQVVAFADEQHLVERDRRADFRRQRLDAHLGARLDAVLLAARLDHCVHWLVAPDLRLASAKTWNYKRIMSFVSMLAPVAQDLQRVDALIRRRLESDVALVRQVAEYIVTSGGKRLRPALLLLACGAAGYRGEARLQLAAVVEFIHTATLLHDDVVDASQLRRGHSTANAAFGNAAAVLVGDFLYSRAFQMMVEVDDVLDYSGDATAIGKSLGDDLAEGKPTLPLIYALRAGTAQQAAVVRHAILEGGRKDFGGVLDVIRACGALDYARQAAQREAQAAARALERLQPSEFKDCLLELASFSVARRS